MSVDPEDLDELVRRVDPDRWLSSRFIASPGRRAEVVTLYAFDYELARAPRVASNPLLGEIRLTWWREALEAIYGGGTVRNHPVARALAELVQRQGLARARLEAMIEARYRELEPVSMDEGEALAWARDTGGAVADLAADLLDPMAGMSLARAGGSAWALAWRVRRSPELRPVFERALVGARAASRGLSPAAFPAVAHAALAAARARGRQTAGLSDRLRVTLAVARGRI